MSEPGNSNPRSAPGGSPGRKYLPPEPVGTPYRGDPAEPFPFEVEPLRSVAPSAPVYPHGPPPAMRAPGSPVGPPPGYGQSPEQRSLMLPEAYTERRLRSANTDPSYRDARTAVWVGVASIFIFGVVVGPIAVLLGARAVRAGQERLGWIAIVTGVVGFVLYVLTLVLIATDVVPSPSEWIETRGKGK